MKDDPIFRARASVSTPLQSQTNSPRRILVVEDDPYICHLSAEVLIQHGFEVNAAEDGAAGWEELQAHNYNLLITEQDLPKLTGVKLVKKLRAARMALPVVLVAEKLPAPEVARSPSLQIAATLVKPFAVDALVNTVETILRATDSPREQIEPSANRRGPPSDRGLRLR